ncbi:hypothetical protein CALCODRAFT_481003 [Calocera cornea HHB12733]|uniref:Uncharacterized protein n=1 Tax=Calocera cornea HHB12733 TaxID=1353952 RepID=A0A165I4M3_9BASI|nr:hypothetical protein CALCODRAFT_481003 [Calocera cornea HHB12733]
MMFASKERLVLRLIDAPETVLHGMSEEFARMQVMNAIAEDNLKVIRRTVGASEDLKSELYRILVAPVSGKELKPKKCYQIVTGTIYETAHEVIEIDDEDNDNEELVVSKAKLKNKGKQRARD